ncbi:MAG: alpha-galactosidase [Treponemataceae bacterium]|nr:alpha-galactosidase [Treponemataceae bacterium]
MQNISRITKHQVTEAGLSLLRCEFFFTTKDSKTPASPPAPDSSHRTIDSISINSLIEEIQGSPADSSLFDDSYAFYRNGWESWDAGWETQADESCPKYISFLIPALKRYIEAPETKYKRNIEYGQFIIWLRWNNLYLVAASTGKGLPPLQYELDRKNRTITCNIYSTGKSWKNDEKTAEICFFITKSYFELKDTIHFLYHDSRFEKLSFLGKTPGGWESWYNHYNKIDESLILEDLNALDTTDNLLKCMYLDRGQPVIFQIDDGWQQGTGQWEINQARFPQGLAELTGKIRKKGYIPGLWIAPFIFDYRVPFIKEHPDWILRDRKGKPIPAGFNAPWGAVIGKEQPAGPCNYFVLDLSRDDVLQYLDQLVDKTINTWGFRYLKLDFLFAGMIYGCFKNGGAAYQWYDRAIKVLTKRTEANDGEKVAYLGCGMPFESSYLDFPLSRIGADTKEDWDYPLLKALRYNGRPSAYVNMKDTLGHAFWNDAVYKNDPDVVFFRKENCSLTDNEKELIALVNGLFAGQIMHADDPAHFDQQAEAPLTQKKLSLYDKLAGASFGNVRIEPDIYIIFSKDNKYTGIINLSDREYSLEEEKVQATAYLQTYGKNPESAEIKKKKYTRIAGQGKTVHTDTGPKLVIPAHSIYIEEGII